MERNIYTDSDYLSYIQELEEEFEDLCISNNRYEKIKEDLVNYKFGLKVDRSCFDDFFTSKVIELSERYSYEGVLDIIYNEYLKKGYIIEDKELNELYENVCNMCYDDYWCYYSSDCWKFYTHNIKRVTKYMYEKHKESTDVQIFDILYSTDSYIISSSIVDSLWYCVDGIPENLLLTDEVIEDRYNKIKHLPPNYTFEDLRNLE